MLSECNRDADITFILDSSGSVNSANFQKMKEFVTQMIGLVNVDGDASNVGVITFGDTAKIEFQLDRHETRFDIQQAVMNVSYTYGTTNTAAALQMLREEMYR